MVSLTSNVNKVHIRSLLCIEINFFINYLLCLKTNLFNPILEWLKTLTQSVEDASPSLIPIKVLEMILLLISNLTVSLSSLSFGMTEKELYIFFKSCLAQCTSKYFPSQSLKIVLFKSLRNSNKRNKRNFTLKSNSNKVMLCWVWRQHYLVFNKMSI